MPFFGWYNRLRACKSRCLRSPVDMKPAKNAAFWEPVGRSLWAPRPAGGNQL